MFLQKILGARGRPPGPAGSAGAPSVPEFCVSIESKGPASEELQVSRTTHKSLARKKQNISVASQMRSPHSVSRFCLFFSRIPSTRSRSSSSQPHGQRHISSHMDTSVVDDLYCDFYPPFGDFQTCQVVNNPSFFVSLFSIMCAELWPFNTVLPTYL